IASCVVGLIAAWLTHKIAAPLALIITLPAIVMTVRSRRHVSRNVLLVGGVGSVAVALIALRASWSELQILFTGNARWELPALALPGKPLLLGREPIMAAVLALLLCGLALALWQSVPANAFIIVPERHIAFMTAWYTRARVRLRPESAPATNRYRLITLAFIKPGSALEHTLERARAELGLTPPLGVHPLHPNGLVLIEEATWQWILAELPPLLRARPAAWPTI
ncbi:MAG: hypothetical protein KBG15_03175, partial [Kofleriaceae bacterium]|nr:hypothetical protein [Kofleriaceae bacterium]